MMGWLTDEIKEGDDITIQIVKALASVLIVGVTVIILFILWQIIFLPSPHAVQPAAAFHNEQQFARLQAKHGKKATQMVVYEESGRAYYYPNGPSGDKVELK